MLDCFEVVETTADTRKRLSNKTDNELIKILVDIDRSIRTGFDYAIYYQEWSVGTDILRLRGYGYLRPSDLKALAKERNL
jgi:hypothetical protein